MSSQTLLIFLPASAESDVVERGLTNSPDNVCRIGQTA
jgi:hypothetical protein